MRHTARLTALAAAALLSACAAPQLTAEQQNQLAPVECRGAEQCGKMWQRAQLWIAQNAAMKLQLVTDVVLQTYSDPAPSSISLSYTVTKEPLGGDVYQIQAAVSCKNQWTCSRPPKLARATLHRFIRETPQ